MGCKSTSWRICCAGVSYSNDLYGGLEEDLDEPYHTDEEPLEAGHTTTFAVSSSLYTPLSTREPAKLPARPLSRLGTPRSLAQQYVSLQPRSAMYQG